MNNCSILEKLAVIYQYLFERLNAIGFDANEAYLSFCQRFGICAFPQKVNFFNKEEIIESEGLLIFVDDDKYGYQAVVFSSLCLDDWLGEHQNTYNAFLIPLKFIDAVKIGVNDTIFRMCPAEREGLFFSNNKLNFDIQTISSLTGFDASKIIEMKNADFLSDAVFENVLKNVSRFAGLDEKRIIAWKTKAKTLFFASKGNVFQDRRVIAEKANELLGTKIVKNSQNSTFDCASFVSYLFMTELGVDIQAGGIGNSTTGKIMSSSVGKNYLIHENKSLQEKYEFVLKNAEIGDVLLFHRQSANSQKVEADNWFPGHVGIYVGDGKYIDARHRRGDVAVVDMKTDEYMNCFIGFKKILETQQLEFKSNERGDC